MTYFLVIYRLVRLRYFSITTELLKCFDTNLFAVFPIAIRPSISSSKIFCILINKLLADLGLHKSRDLIIKIMLLQPGTSVVILGLPMREASSNALDVPSVRRQYKAITLFKIISYIIFMPKIFY